jgi:hypothetical protein
LFDGHAVSPDLTETAEEVDADAVVAQRDLNDSMFAFTTRARSATHSGAAPMGRRASPTAKPWSFIISFEGNGFGASSPVSKA